MSWTVRWENVAAAELARLDRLDPKQARRIRTRVQGLAETGRGDIVKLQGRKDEWRLRVGDWRVVFTFDGVAREIIVIRLGLRNERAYRD